MLAITEYLGTVGCHSGCRAAYSQTLKMTALNCSVKIPSKQLSMLKQQSNEDQNKVAFALNSYECKRGGA